MRLVIFESGRTRHTGVTARIAFKKMRWIAHVFDVAFLSFPDMFSEGPSEQDLEFRGRNERGLSDGLRNEALVPGVESRSLFYDLGIGTR